MNRLSEGLRAALNPAMAEELRLFFADMAEDAQERECALNLTLENLLKEIKELEHSRTMMEEEWQSERARMNGALAAARHDVQEHHQEALIRLRSEAQRRTEEFETERQKRYALEQQLKIVTFHLELKEDEKYDKMMAKETERMIADSERWARQTKEREVCALSIALSAVVMKQRLLKELKSQAEKWMVSGGSIQGASIPPVFQSWMMRNEWQKLQNNKECLNDDLQSFISRKDIEKVIAMNKSLSGKIDAKFERMMEQHMTEAKKEQEKIRAAELKQRMKLEEKTRKALEKVKKAELKVKQMQEAKEKKEAEKLERKRAKEERKRNRTKQSIFCFCFR